MKKFYFTFGSGSVNQAYSGGWVEVYAPDVAKAVKTFTQRFGMSENNLVPCCDWYGENSPTMQEMLKQGNVGKCCHEVLRYEEADKDCMVVRCGHGIPEYTISFAPPKTYGVLEKDKYRLRQHIGDGTHEDGRKFEICTTANYAPMVYLPNQKGVCKAFVMSWESVVELAQAAGLFDEDETKKDDAPAETDTPSGLAN